MSELYIGLMSGTSLDGIDLALVDFSHPFPKLIGTHYQPYSVEQRQKILAVCSARDNEIPHYAELDILLGKLFAQAINEFLRAQNYKQEDIQAIGSHGQTIRHMPSGDFPYTLQIGDPNIISAETGIITVADFRRRDLAYGGQGAPLVPAFHQKVFASDKIDRTIVNIGGIANITLLPKNRDQVVMGFDTGPGNVLLDSWIMQHQQKMHDENGDWARTGKVNQPLLTRLLMDPFFLTPPPKSTGREYFNLSWLEKFLTTIDPVDVQATLVELSARSILQAVSVYFSQGEIFVSGGGAHNGFLIERLQELAQTNFTVASTEKLGIDPDWVEAMTFAWLARQTLAKKSGNLPSVTGARCEAVLGAVYFV